MNEMLEKEIVRLYSELAKVDPTSDEYETITNRLTEIHRLMINEQTQEIERLKVKKSGRITTGDMLATATNLIGIGLILNHEKLNVISTKALGFVRKIRF